MYRDKVVVVVMPAYNAEDTLEITYNEIPFDIVDEVILVDDHGTDNTSELAKKYGVRGIPQLFLVDGEGTIRFVSHRVSDIAAQVEKELP